MNSVVVLSGVVVGLIATTLVFVDALRRGFSSKSRWIWSGMVAGISIGGFVTVHVFNSYLYRLYAELTNSSAVAPVPRKLTEGLLLVWLLLGAIAVLTYWFGSRHELLKIT